MCCAHKLPPRPPAGGPHLERLAARARPSALATYPLPLPLANGAQKDTCNFSFSGLKTQVGPHGPYPPTHSTLCPPPSTSCCGCCIPSHRSSARLLPAISGRGPHPTTSHTDWPNHARPPAHPAARACAGDGAARSEAPRAGLGPGPPPRQGAPLGLLPLPPPHPPPRTGIRAGAGEGGGEGGGNSRADTVPILPTLGALQSSEAAPDRPAAADN